MYGTAYVPTYYTVLRTVPYRVYIKKYICIYFFRYIHIYIYMYEPMCICVVEIHEYIVRCVLRTLRHYQFPFFSMLPGAIRRGARGVGAPAPPWATAAAAMGPRAVRRGAPGGEGG